MRPLPIPAAAILIALSCLAKADEPRLVTVRQVSENPYTLRGSVFALAPPSSNVSFTKSEISEGLYEIRFSMSPRTAVMNLTRDQLAAVSRSWEIYVELVDGGRFEHTIRLRALGNTLSFRRQWIAGSGFENIPTNIRWK
jgi:hypothetical protein